MFLGRYKWISFSLFVLLLLLKLLLLRVGRGWLLKVIIWGEFIIVIVIKF